MSSHADTIRRVIEYAESESAYGEFPEARAAVDAWEAETKQLIAQYDELYEETQTVVDARDSLRAENQRLRDALEAARPYVHYAGYTLAYSPTVEDQVEAALAEEADRG